MTILDEDFFKMRGMWAKDKKKPTTVDPSKDFQACY